MQLNLIFILIVGAAVAAAAGYVGSLMVLKRMSLVGDALSHVALPGMAIAISFGISPILGAFSALTLAIFGIWYLEEHTETYPEAIVGLFFTASLALGVLITNQLDLLEALFGDIQTIQVAEGVISIIISFLVIAITYFLYKKLMIMIISPELAKSAGISVKLINFLYLFMVGVVVSLGIKFVGTLLTGALVIIPAAAAKNITKGIVSYSITSMLAGIISALVGIFIAYTYNLSPGPVVVLTSGVIFVISYIGKKIFSI